ncbi:hypothetical protein PND55_06165 [Faecalitalea cylindroides]|uniref:hypothetical protein n=1 Tax=Faecalitalea cylindroides TaxID=39483 RepID=UPI001896E06B|nr:hypothetical protein [Faecalitalea cylindroides]MDB7950843.1 hypothetical protein [Faecalitalea cylindroides]
MKRAAELNQFSGLFDYGNVMHICLYSKNKMRFSAFLSLQNPLLLKKLFYSLHVSPQLKETK